MKAQGFDRRKLVYNNPLQPYLSYWGIFWITIFILINGYSVFWNFTASGFLTACKFYLSDRTAVELTVALLRYQYSPILRVVLGLEDR